MASCYGMASVHRDSRSPAGVWYCSFQRSDGRRTFRSTGTKIKSRAKIICDSWQAAERAAEDGTLSASRGAEIINEMLRRIGQEPVARLRLGEWFTEWLESKTDVSPQILKRYGFSAKSFLKFLGEGSERRLLESINEADIRRFAAALKAEGRCGATVNRIVRADLGNAFNRALKLGKIKHSPVAGVAPEKDAGRLPRTPFTPTQVAQLIATSSGTDWEGAIRCAYTTGARLQDVANLRWSAIHLQVGVLDFKQGKTGIQTVVAIHPDFENWLLRNVSDDPHGFLFPRLSKRPSGGKKGLTVEFNSIVERSGIDPGLVREKKGARGKHRKNLTFHSLRHTAASLVYNAAIVKETARRITAHAPGGALDRYVHLDIDAIKNATALIPRLPI
jgi:integrase